MSISFIHSFIILELRNMYLSKFYVLLFLVFVAKDAFGYVLKRGPCLYILNGEFKEEEFNNVTQICCSGSGVHDKGKGFKIECCGETTFKPDTEICCGEQVYDSAYDKRICCGNDSESKQGVIHSVSNMQKPECCGNQVYSSLEKSCLDGVLLDKKSKRNPQDVIFTKTIEQTGKSLLQELQRYINLSTAEAHQRKKEALKD